MGTWRSDKLVVDDKGGGRVSVMVDDCDSFVISLEVGGGDVICVATSSMVEEAEAVTMG